MEIYISLLYRRRLLLFTQLDIIFFLNTQQEWQKQQFLCLCCDRQFFMSMCVHVVVLNTPHRSPRYRNCWAGTSENHIFPLAKIFVAWGN